MLRYAAIALLASCSASCLAATQPLSRLETDFTAQKYALKCYVGSTSNPSCGRDGVLVFMAGGDLRKLDYREFDYREGMDHRIVRREFYYSRGNCALVIESSLNFLDEHSHPLNQPRVENVRRYWLDDKSVDASGRDTRVELRKQAVFLRSYFRANRKEFAPGKPD